jgi:catechol 2,3-dioxygenase-like lactoylglutathione lyase family enzyme
MAPVANARRNSNAVTNGVEFCASSPGEKTMRRYHHIGIPTTEAKPGETHLKHLKLFVVSHEKSEFGVEWMRFEADAEVPDLVRQVPHVAFEVADLTSELAGREILIPPNSPSDGVRVAFIVENGVPIELLEFTDPKHPARLSNRQRE